MLSFRTVFPDTLELLKKLMQEPLLSEFRLVGGTGLALQYGHRTSVDLDLFGNATIDRNKLKDCLQNMGELVVLNESRPIFQCSLNGVKIDIVTYRYPWIDEVIVEDGIRLASDKDIAAMKINAVQGRGTRKDFVDVYILLQHYSLAEILDFYKQKYPEYSMFRALLSLSYFQDAEVQPMPNMFIPDTWETMKQAILQQIKGYKQ